MPYYPPASSGGGGGGISNVVEDTSPQLGGILDLNGFTVGDADAGDLTLLHALTATSTELNYVDGVTSAIQAQLDGKQAVLTGLLPTVTELNYVDGVTSAIQGQIDGKQPLDADLTDLATGVFNEAGADKDFRIEGDTDANLFFVDASTDKIGFGTATPGEKLTVAGNFQLDDAATPTKGYRFRTTGTNLDLDFYGVEKNLYFSGYSSADFSGTQVQFIEFSAAFSFTKFYQKSIWLGSTGADGMIWDKGGNFLEVVGLTRTDSFRLDQTPTAGTITPTHTITINCNGTDYKIPVVAA